MPITRAQMQKELVPGLHELFGLEYDRYGKEWAEFYEQATTERAFEEEVKLAGFGVAPVKNEGGPIQYQTGQEAWTARFTPFTVAMAFALTEEAIEDNLYVSVANRYTKAAARSMAYSKEVFGANILNNATSGSYTYGDGVALLSTAHPLVNGGTNSNTFSTHADLNETSIEAATIQIAAWTDEQGLLIAARPKKLVIPPNLMFTAKRLLSTVLRTGTADNDISAIVADNTIPEGFTVNHFLTNTTRWFLKTDVPNGLKYFQRIGMEKKDEGDFETGNWRQKFRERYVFGVADPLGIFGT